MLALTVPYLTALIVVPELGVRYFWLVMLLTLKRICTLLSMLTLPKL